MESCFVTSVMESYLANKIARCISITAKNVSMAHIKKLPRKELLKKLASKEPEECIAEESLDHLVAQLLYITSLQSLQHHQGMRMMRNMAPRMSFSGNIYIRLLTKFECMYNP